MTRNVRIYAAFMLSGIAGLIYEVVWSRYLALYVGHSAYAQILVLAVYLGGMAIGALIVADLSRRVSQPLAWYIRAEVVLALFGLLFHPLFLLVTNFSYEVLFPALGSASLVGGVRWGLAALLILPQAVVLGATFPFMAASLARADAARPGRAVAVAYLLNTVGGASGVLLSGFLLVGLVGLPGTVATAAGLNLLAAGLVGLSLRAKKPGVGTQRSGEPAKEAAAEPSPALSAGPELGTVLLVVAFGTALASFAYEIGWIRMLSLVLGSATHAFELMLSAFILGLAGGAWLIRKSVDRTADPVRLLGRIQVAMGVAALASLPVYLMTYSPMSTLVTDLPTTQSGYMLFNLGRYGLCLLVMLPATVLAGMTLPVITGTLLRAGWGERSIGTVYGVNTIGSVAGAALAGLVALPVIGLKGLLVVGAGVDIGLGIWVLERSARWGGRPRVSAGLVGLGGAVVLVLATTGIQLDQQLLTSGVFRVGYLPRPGDREVLFYEDGRTATVSAHVAVTPPVVVLNTNGKPDAALSSRWFADYADSLPRLPIADDTDFTTQVLAPVIGLAHAPEAREIAAIGHGSGMSGVALLGGRSVERLVTVEIEPQMVEGSKVFLPVNELVFNDPRSTFVFDDAKSYFAYEPGSFDIVFAEPSNLWVSGVADLFSQEFYDRLQDVVAPGGVIVQWIHVYELNDDLFLGVLAALEQSFPYYRGYLTGPADVAIVAGREPLREPDWSVLGSEGMRAMTRGAPEFTSRHLDALFLFDEQTFAPVLAQGVRPHSDFRPTLDIGAERARFFGTMAQGIYSFAIDRIDLEAAWKDEVRSPIPYELPPATDLRPLTDWERAAWTREAVAAGGGEAPVQFGEWTDYLIELGDVYRQLRTPALWTAGRGAWLPWAAGFLRADNELHRGTAGWVDSTFYDAAFDFLDATDAPPTARAVVDLMYGVNSFNWERSASAADVLVARVAAGERWVTPTLLLDAAVLAYVKTGRPDAARTAFRTLVESTQRETWNLRNRLLEAYIDDGASD